jgi:CubicO group peptidase (beta-lactamase class C family)
MASTPRVGSRVPSALQQGDPTIFAGAYGLASPRWGIPNTLDTRFDTASIAKLFTSVAVLQLVGRGMLALDASIHEYVDVAGTTISRDDSLRHLLTHTSGLADDSDAGGRCVSRRFKSAEAQSGAASRGT